MNGISNKPYIDCQEFIDVEYLKSLNLEICRGIAVSDIKAGVYGPGVIESKKYGNFLMTKTKMALSNSKIKWNEMTHNQQNIFSKLYFDLYNPSTVVYLTESKKTIDGLTAYKNKSSNQYWEWCNNVNYFPNLKVWLETLLGNIFTNYGRIIFFIHEHDCELLLHRDGIKYYPHKNEFLWINPMMKKKFYIYDENTKQKKYVDTPVAFFNDLDIHGGDKSDTMTWSLRIDGVFTDQFRKKLNIFNVEKY